MLDYFYGNETEQYLFYQVPVILIKEQKFKSLSGDAKLLYGLFLNRTSLSIRNNWHDEQGRVYIIYTIEEIMEDMNCSEKKAIKLTKELKDIGLIETIRRGLNKPNLIYVKNFATVLKYPKQPSNTVNTRNCNFDSSGTGENDSSGTHQNTVQEQEFLQARYIDVSYSEPKENLRNRYTDEKSKSKSKSKSDGSAVALSTADETKIGQDSDAVTDHAAQTKYTKKEPPLIPKRASTRLAESSSKNVIEDYTIYEEIIKRNISYDDFLQEGTDISLVDDFIACITDTMLTDSQTQIKIDKEIKPISVIKSVLMKLNYEHIQHAIEQYKAQHHKITHKRPYIRNMLYNTYLEFNAHYTNQVRVDGVIW